LKLLLMTVKAIVVSRLASARAHEPSPPRAKRNRAALQPSPARPRFDIDAAAPAI